MLNNKLATEMDYPQILEIWENSVRKTHYFLSDKDLLFYKKIIPQALDSVNLLIWYNQNQAIGFSGIDNDELVMLFLDPKFIGRGYGSQILTYLVQKYDIQKIDVNSQNTAAKKFYLKHDFEIATEDPIDGFGKPYPITHLVRKNFED